MRILQLIAVLGVMTALAACLPSSLSGRDASSQRGDGDVTRITVLAAASLTDVFEDIGVAFEAMNPGVEIVFSFAGSQQLAQQLIQGAPADVFASADERQMTLVANAIRTLNEHPRNFATNQLTVVYPASNPAAVSTLQDLSDPGVKLITAAPEVPAGRYTEQFLARAETAFGADWVSGVRQNVVSLEPNVRAVLRKVSLGEADAGFVYRSDLSGLFPNDVREIELPPDLNVRAVYPIAVFAESKQRDWGQRFVTFLSSPEAQAILRRNGFEPVSPL